MLDNRFFNIASSYLAATVVFYGASKVASDAGPGVLASAAQIAAAGAFVWIGMVMWKLYRAVPQPGMLCCALAVTILGGAAALDVGLFDRQLVPSMADAAMLQVFIAGVMLLAASLFLLPANAIAFVREVVIPALLRRKR